MSLLIIVEVLESLARAIRRETVLVHRVVS